MHQSKPCQRNIQAWGANAAISLLAFLGLSGAWLITEAIAPPAVQAYTGRLAISLEAQPDETFEALTRRAEAVARAAAQRNFDRDILVTDVQIIVSAEKLSRISPILTLEATRYQWSRQPDPRRWATYYKNAKRLLGFSDSPTTVTITAPAARPPAATPAQPNTTTAPSTTTAPTAPVQPFSPFPSSTQQPLSPFPATTSPSSTPAPTGQPTERPQIIPDRIPSPVR